MANIFWRTVSNVISSKTSIVYILIAITLKFVPHKSLINNRLPLVQVMALRWTGNKQLPAPMLNQIFDAIWCHLASLWCYKKHIKHKYTEVKTVNSSDAEDVIFQPYGSMPCLLMPWLLKSSEHQLACYWLCRTDDMCCCSRVNFICLGHVISKIWFKMWIYPL